MDWLYERTEDNSARFVLGIRGDNPLVCFGINPSTAEPNSLDPTVNCVRNVATSNGFDSFIMLNVHPQRATNPNDLHDPYLPELKAINERRIAALIAGRELMLWAAWGALITKRAYLPSLAQCIARLPELQRCHWVSRGKATKDGHPHHPLYVKRDAPFQPLGVEWYHG